ncbi:uncharacterized protein At4g04775-like [Eutrema salsugineum]|uniref:uncharacterized protein At4g04775-like n=1 Tax=Eutrema salsugineum TaxID=72664 RepID=UPI000CECE6D4|nr:uncharacterized protein At4g04775-like [Eutrema salsugineum]
MSGASSGTSAVRGIGRFVGGVPKRCWCGEVIVPKISKSDGNPYRRYYRLSMTTTFSIDEALLNEIEALVLRTGRLEQEVKELLSVSMDDKKKMFEKLEVKLEKDILEKVEEVLVEAKAEMKKMFFFVGLGCLIIVTDCVVFVDK